MTPKFKTDPDGTRSTSPPAVRRVEWAGAITIATAIAAVVTWWSRDLWFFSDLWDFLAARDGSFEALMRQHGGHWALWTAIAVRAVARVGKMDFFPAYVLPITLLYAGYSIVLWRILRWRGTRPVSSLIVVALVGFLGTSAWMQNVTYLALVLVHLAVLGLAVLLEADQPGWPQLAAASALLVVAVSAEGTGTAALAAFIAVVAILRRFRWLVATIPPVGIYAWWWWTFGRLTPDALSPHVDLEIVIKTPKAAIDILVGGVSALTPLAGLGAFVGLVGVASVVLWAWVKFGLDAFDLMMGTTLLVVVGLIALVRVASGGFPADSGQYSFSVVLLLMPVVVPKVQILVSSLETAGKSMALAVMLAVIAFNAAILQDGIATRAAVQQAHIDRVFAAGQIVAAGEPFLPFAEVTPQLSGVSIERLNNRYPGWYVKPVDSRTEEASRGMLRTSINLSGAVSGTPLIIPFSPGRDACAVFNRDSTVEMIATGPGRVQLTMDQPSSLTIEWLDRWGVGTNVVRNTSEVSVLSYAADSEANLALVVDPPTQIQLCGVTANPQP